MRLAQFDGFFLMLILGLSFILNSSQSNSDDEENEAREPSKVSNNTNLKSLSHFRQAYGPAPIPYGSPDLSQPSHAVYHEIAKLDEREKDRMIYFLLDKLNYLIKTSCKGTNPYKPPGNQLVNFPIGHPYYQPSPQPSQVYPTRPGMRPTKPIYGPLDWNKYPMGPEVSPPKQVYDPTKWHPYPIRTSTRPYYTHPASTQRPTTTRPYDIRPPVYPVDESYGRYLYISEEKFWNLYHKLISSSHDREFLANLSELEQYVQHAQAICEKSKAFSSVLSKIKRPHMIPNRYDNTDSYLTNNNYQPVNSYNSGSYDKYPMYNHAAAASRGYPTNNYENEYPTTSQTRYPQSYEQYQPNNYEQYAYEYDEPDRYGYK